MGLSFTDSSSYFMTSESVTEGHPDKLCDQISDAVLDSVLASDPDGRVACETCITNGLVVVMGEITTATYVDIPALVRETLRQAGYIHAEYGIDYKSCGVIVAVQEQSKDISASVDRSLEVRYLGLVNSNSEDLDRLGAGDQGMMVGFACVETPELMPLPISLAHKLCQRLSMIRREGILPYLWPDGKSQVTVEYEHGIPKRVDTVVISAQHSPEVNLDVLNRDIMEHIVEPVVPGSLMDKDTKYFINPSGKFVTGGPAGDTGLTGRKLLVDTYGGVARHGGGAFSGKDSSKVDRSGAYAARYVAKNIVAAGLADRVEIQVSYAIGVARPVAISVETFGTGRVDDEIIEKLVEKHFDLRPAAIIKELNLKHPGYKGVACYGHFGRNDLNLTWERTDKAELLRAEAGLKP